MIRSPGAEAGRSIRPLFFVEWSWPAETRTVARFWPRRVIASKLLGEATPLLVARNVESLARILVFPARTPVARSAVARRRRLRAPSGDQRCALLLLRCPESSSGEPLQHGIGVACLQLTQRRDQLLLRVRAEGGGFSFEDDCPVVVPRRHGTNDYGSFDGPAGGSRRLSFSMSVVRFKFSNFAAWRLLPWVRSSERRISDSSTVSM